MMLSGADCLQVIALFVWRMNLDKTPSVKLEGLHSFQQQVQQALRKQDELTHRSM